jgi:hypothetical protein
MESNISRKYFYKNGKRLRIKEPKQEWLDKLNQKKDCLTSLFEIQTTTTLTSEKESLISKFKSSIKSRVIPSVISRRVTTVWASMSVVFIFTFLITLMLTPQKARPMDTTRYAIYSSKPLVLEQSTTTIYSKDSRSQKLNEVFRMFKCPLEGMGDAFVYEADKNSIPWWLAASVAFQESSCGKNTPKVDGIESYNAWGWAVYGDMVFSFDNYARGIETVSKYFSTRFFKQGITDTCEIMKIYTPPSNGSWCEGVNHFAEIIRDYKTPEGN